MANLINTRIQLKYDSYANWDAVKTTFVPLKGEICIVNPGTNLSDASTVPCLMKIGDGISTFEKLPWASATAADVYSWAKQTGLTITKDGTGNVVSGIEWDATANNGKGGIKFTTISVATSEGLEEVQRTVSDLETEVYGEGGSKDNSRIDKLEKDISDNREAWAKDDNTTYTFELSDNKKIITVTPSSGSAVSLELNYLNETEINNLLVASGYITESAVDNKLGEYAKSNEVVNSIQGEEGIIKIEGTTQNPVIKIASGVFEGAGAATALQSDLEDGLVKVAAAETADKVAKTLSVGSKTYNGSADVEITAADLGLNNALRFVGSFSEAPATAESGDVYLNTATRKEYIYANGEWQEFGDEGSYALKTITITGTDGLTGGGDLTANRAIGIADGGVTEAKLAANAVTKDKIADFAISVDKLDMTLRSEIDVGTTAVQQVIAGNGIAVEHQDGYIEKVSVNEVLKHVSQIGDMDIAGIQVDTSSQERASIFGATYVNLTTSGGGQIHVDEESLGTAYYHGEEIATLGDIKTYTGSNSITVDGTVIKLDSVPVVDGIQSPQGADYGEIGFNSDGMLIDHLQGIVIQSGDGDLDLSGNNVRIGSGDEINISSSTAVNLTSPYLGLNGDVYINDNHVHEIATTGSIYDIAEGSNTSTGTDAVEYLIFNCGTATTII